MSPKTSSLSSRPATYATTPTTPGRRPRWHRIGAPSGRECVTDRIERSLCVFCRRHPVDSAWRPFCSERCKIQDLARWADGAYRVPGETSEQPKGPTEDLELKTQNSKLKTHK